MSKIVILTENQFGEMMAYHGSGSDFDKFNHKKYLNTGAGSQSFGWGTYVTNDEAIGRSYSSIREEDVIEDYVYWLENGYDYWGIKNSENKFKSEFIENHINYFSNYFGQKDAYDAADLAFDILLSSRFSKSASITAVNSALKSCEDKVLYKGHGIKMTDEELDVLSNKYRVIIGLFRQLNAKETKKLLYQVDIPDDNGQNYIEWYEEFPSVFMKRILEGFLKLHDKYLDSMAENNYPFRCDLYQDIQWMKQNPDMANKMIDIISNGDYEDFFSSSYYTNKALTDGGSVYRRLQQIFFGKDKAASLFLMQCGFDGIKYPSGTRWQKPDGASEDAYNYVIFDANKVKIINKTRI